MEIKPISFKQACDYIVLYHRHHKPTVGCKFCIGCFDDGKMVGVAVCGRPVSRYLDNGETCEVNRLCTDGTRNACSMLYGASCRVAKAMGYKKMVTYILQSEPGTSLKASGFVFDGVCGGKNWNNSKRTKSRAKPSATLEQPQELKQRWVKEL